MLDDDDRVPSLDACIAAFATDSGAPPSFVAKIRALFESKGISLQCSARPYLGALREAFRREETLRRLSGRQELRQLDADWERQLAHLRSLQDALQARMRQLRAGVERLKVPPRTVLCPGSVELPFVPGPDGLQ